MAIKKYRSFARQYRLRPLRTRASHTREAQEGWHWFDHPEMQARIARAEADRAAGRVQFSNSLGELLAQLRAVE